VSDAWLASFRASHPQCRRVNAIENR